MPERIPMGHESEHHLQRWSERETIAEAIIPLVGRLYRENGVVTSIHGRRLINKSAIGVLKAHNLTRQGAEFSVEETLPVIEALTHLDLGPASVDVASLLLRYQEQGGDLTGFLRSELAPVVGRSAEESAEPVDVVLYGFGRIGRLLARILVAHQGGGASGLRLRAIVVRRGSENDLLKRASLLRRDSVHGPFEGTIEIDEENDTILANGTLIQVIYSDSPSDVDYTAYGIRDAVVVDNTGRWRDAEGLSQHLASPGVARVLLTAPGKGEIKNIVHGINHESITAEDRILSAASCTTNAITPVLKAINDAYGVAHGHVETVHSFTNDQNLIDNFHKGDRRGRSAPLNMVITETGAAKAVAKALPELAGKLTGNAIRVPTPNVSLAILNLTLDREATREEVNEYLRELALTSVLRQQIDYVESAEIVSSDFVGTSRAGIVDGLATLSTGRHLVLYVWYDNEFGYSRQVIRVLETIAGNHPRVFPERTPVAVG
ncbi:glyceraldehyde-3-phosphate dehydrogenase [Salinibacterium sp. SYSU T00001]|nr:glyceraldehyde-3-phosphate dehydrogenase [Salinibacterium sedimenticola]MCW4384249.1 glyceraldehyde-3-phosphate dehydrogenase [Salinibacterium sedimenticola]